MLDRAIATGTASSEDVERIGGALAKFYRSAVPHRISAEAYL
jgi:hypothetical protein